jgi:hypothetical protein
VSSASSRYLQCISDKIDGEMKLHGAQILHLCFGTLLGGTQALQPASTDCIFAIVSLSIGWPIPGDPTSSVAHRWVEAAFTATAPCVSVDHWRTAMNLLLKFALDGPKSKSKAKMLLADFSLIAKGDIAAESLASYS